MQDIIDTFIVHQPCGPCFYTHPWNWEYMEVALQSNVKIPLLGQGWEHKNYQVAPGKNLIWVVETLRSLGGLDKEIQSLPLTSVKCQTMLSPSTEHVPPSNFCKTKFRHAYLMISPFCLELYIAISSCKSLKFSIEVGGLLKLRGKLTAFFKGSDSVLLISSKMPLIRNCSHDSLK